MKKAQNPPIAPLAVGPLAYENWRAADRGEVKDIGAEVPLFTDAQITGEIAKEIGPYQLLNAIATGRGSPYEPAVILRYWLHCAPSIKLPTNKTNVEGYHGGGLADELAALVSLCMGIRLKAGAESRSFGGFVKDPLGRPYSTHAKTNPATPKVRERPILPRCIGEHCLNTSCGLLATLPALNLIAANALIRSARSYQEALWIAESSPHLAWLLLVSATETAASFWRAEEVRPIDKIKASRPELLSSLRRHGSEKWVRQIAKDLAPYMGATKTFTDFILAFLPKAPSPRQNRGQHKWDSKTLLASLKVIYKWRSRALHGGVPFPPPMCEPPIENEWPEIPLAVATATHGGSWTAKDMPMLLHLFEYVVRGAINNWWAKMAPVAVPANLAME